MSEHHTLGEAGRAPGVEHAGQVSSSAHRIGHGQRVRDQRLVRQHVRRRRGVTGMDDRLQRLREFAQLRHQRGERVIDDQHSRVAIVERIRDLGRGPANVYRVHGATRPRHGHVVLEVAIAVERQHPDPVARLQSHRLQRTGEPSDAITELCECSPPLAEYGCSGLRLARQRAVQALCEIHAEFLQAPSRRLVYHRRAGTQTMSEPQTKVER